VFFFGWHECPAQFLEVARPPGSEDGDGDDTYAEPSKRGEGQQVH
jgi:hypothetical protein